MQDVLMHLRGRPFSALCAWVMEALSPRSRERAGRQPPAWQIRNTRWVTDESLDATPMTSPQIECPRVLELIPPIAQHLIVETARLPPSFRATIPQHAERAAWYICLAKECIHPGLMSPDLIPHVWELLCVIPAADLQLPPAIRRSSFLCWVLLEWSSEPLSVFSAGPPGFSRRVRLLPSVTPPRAATMSSTLALRTR